MSWTSLIGPAVVAAIIAGIVAVVGFFVNRATVRGMHSERLAFEGKQAERRGKLELDLIQRKADADIDLAERRFALDKALLRWRRRYELAEQVLAVAYEARDALTWARARVVLEGEGESREAKESESDKVRQARSSAFVPIERLNRDAKAFATLQTLQDPLAAHFGPDAIAPVAAMMGAHRSIASAAATLVRHADPDEDRLDRRSMEPIRKILWGERPDDIDENVAKAIEQLEAICRPILSEKIPA